MNANDAGREASHAAAIDVNRIQFRWGSEEDQEDIEALLSAVGLPLAGINEHMKTTLLMVQPGGAPRVIGCSALARHGDGALLRSVAIHPEIQGQGWGTQLVRRLLIWSRQQRIQRVYLLAHRSQSFFEGLGFAKMEHGELPEFVKNSGIYSACGDRAQPMQQELTADLR